MNHTAPCVRCMSLLTSTPQAEGEEREWVGERRHCSCPHLNTCMIFCTHHSVSLSSLQKRKREHGFNLSNQQDPLASGGQRRAFTVLCGTTACTDKHEPLLCWCTVLYTLSIDADSSLKPTELSLQSTINCCPDTFSIFYKNANKYRYGKLKTNDNPPLLTTILYCDNWNLSRSVWTSYSQALIHARLFPPLLPSTHPLLPVLLSEQYDKEIKTISQALGIRESGCLNGQNSIDQKSSAPELLKGVLYIR